jgi:hypothetical protein
MRIPGKRLRRTRLIQSSEFVVAVEVEMVVPEEDPSEPCFEAEAVQFFCEVAERARRCDLDWMKAHDKVYRAVDAA